MKTTDNIHALAETFLSEYLAQTGSRSEPAQLTSAVPRSAPYVAASQAAASEFIKEHLKANGSKRTATHRYEIQVSNTVILARRTGNVTTFFYGWKAQRPLFTHAHHLAQAVDPATTEKLVRTLREIGIEVAAFSAPKMRRGSL